MIEQVKEILNKEAIHNVEYGEYNGKVLHSDQFDDVSEEICQLFCDKQIKDGYCSYLGINDYKKREGSLNEFKSQVTGVMELLIDKTGFTEQQIQRSLDKLK